MRETVARSIVKAGSYRIWGEAVTFGVAYAFTGSIKTAASISAVEVLLKIGMYAAHERIWNRIKWGKIPDNARNQNMNQQPEGGLEVQASRPANASYELTAAS